MLPIVLRASLSQLASQRIAIRKKLGMLENQILRASSSSTTFAKNVLAHILDLEYRINDNARVEPRRSGGLTRRHIHHGTRRKHVHFKAHSNLMSHLCVRQYVNFPLSSITRHKRRTAIRTKAKLGLL